MPPHRPPCLVTLRPTRDPLCAMVASAFTNLASGAATSTTGLVARYQRSLYGRLLRQVMLVSRCCTWSMPDLNFSLASIKSVAPRPRAAAKREHSCDVDAVATLASSFSHLDVPTQPYAADRMHMTATDMLRADEGKGRGNREDSSNDLGLANYLTNRWP